MGRFLRRLWNALRPDRAEDQLARETAAHLLLLEDDCRRRGMSADDARVAARRAFGGVEQMKDRQRDARSFVWLDDLRRDVPYAARMLRRTPGFSAAAIVTLALGIGANTAVFSLVNSLLLRALPVVEPQQLVTVTTAKESSAPWSFGIWEQIRQRSVMFGGAFAWSAVQFNLAQGGETQLVDGLFASGDFFTALGVPALVGRTFTSADDVRGGGADGPVAVISYAMWQRRFGGSAGVIGTRLTVERVPFTIIGVTPPEFFGAEIGRAFDIALPIGAEPLIHTRNSILDEQGAYWLTVMLRLKPAQLLESAAAMLRGAQPRMCEAAMPQNGPPGFAQVFLTDPFVLAPAAVGTSRLRERYQQPLLVMLVVVALVLLIACVNLANLLLARTTGRRHEFTVRLALGASRWRLVRQLMAESLILGGIGAAAGLVVAAWASRALVAQLSNQVDRVILDVSIDWRVAAFTAAVTVATVALFGLAPVFHGTRVRAIDVLIPRSMYALGFRSAASGLVVGQVALAIMLVVVAGLFVRTFERLTTMSLGFDSHRVLLIKVDGSRARVVPANRLRLYDQLVGSVAAVPGVASAAASMVTPVGGGDMINVVDVPGAPPMSERERTVQLNYVTPGWFATYGTGMRAGRDFDDRDAADAPLVYIVNEAFARRFLTGGNAVGATVANAIRVPGQARSLKTVIGVVDDAVYRSLREAVRPTMYAPLAQLRFAPPNIRISVRSSGGPPSALAHGVVATLTAVERDLALTVLPLSDQVSASLAQDRIVAQLSAFFGALALLLAAVGLYGVTAYGAVRRRTEIGIRMALGAQRGAVVTLVLRETIGLTAVGMVLGLAGAAATTRYLEGMLFGVRPLDLPTFAVVALVFASVATLAALMPARRATRVDPLVALRCE